MRNRLGFVALWLLLCVAAGATPYQWPGEVGPAFLAPTDVRREGRIEGACLQGALVDIRYGQVCLDRAGVGEILDTNKNSVVTLDGRAISNDALQKALKSSSITAVVRYNPKTGQIGWLDAYTQTANKGELRAKFTPWKGPAYEAGETVKISVPRGREARLSIPGVCHNLAMQRDGEGTSATVEILQGWDLREVPIYLLAEGEVFQVGQLSVSTSGPEVIGFGPRRASRYSAQIPAWVDLHSEAGLLEPSSIKVTVSNGAEVLDLRRRVDRTDFKLQLPGHGTYVVTVQASDRMGRTVEQQWPVTVR